MLVDPTCEVKMWEVLKFSVGFPRRVLVLSILCGINAHFLGSSRICGGDACPACKSGIASKFVGYVAVQYERKQRLLRLTGTSATVGMNLGLWQAGHVIEVEKFKERRPLRIVGSGELAGFSRSAAVGAVELLSVVARLHGLPGLDVGLTLNDAKELLEKSAVVSVGLALRGVGP